MNYEGNGCKVWLGYNDLIGLYGLELIMIQVRFVNIRESGFRTPEKRTGIFVLAGSRFLALETRIQVPLTKNTKPSTWNLESMPWNSESKITLHGARSVLLKGSLCSCGSRGRVWGRPPYF